MTDRVRRELPEDRAVLFALNAAAFETDLEARLVDALREAAHPYVSLVCEDRTDGSLLGHVLFTRVHLADVERTPAMALAPMAVRPDRQRVGLGSRLVQAGLDELRAIGEHVVFVLGHPGYYPRFGFEPASARNYSFGDERFDGAFFVLELEPGALPAARTRTAVEYHPAFASVS